MRIIIDIIVIILLCGSCLTMTLPSEKPATDVAAQCFLNALIRETTDWKLTEYPPDELLIPLDEQKSLHFRVAYFSPTQHHQYRFPATLIQTDSDRSDAVNFPQLVDLILEKIFALLSFPATGLTINTYFISVTSQIHL